MNRPSRTPRCHSPAAPADGRPHRLCIGALILALLFSLPPAAAQRPCNDTIVRLFDTICEGDTLIYRDRLLDHSGIYYDTIPRTDTLCDSIIIMRLSVMPIPELSIYHRKHCTPFLAYDLLGGYPQVTHYSWTADPPDSTLAGQENQSWVRVNPRQPTTYTLYLDYRISPPLCPATSSITVVPIENVTAAMHVTPDEITYDNMHIIVEDFSTGTRENHWGGWAGRNWYINGQRQAQNGEWVEFYGTPDWGDTVHIMMEAYTPTCLDTAYAHIPFRRSAVYIPNIFTPDGPSNNTIAPLTSGILEYQLWIYDRRGQLIFHTTDTGPAWNGTTQNGQPCPQGTYSYHCRYRDSITPAGYNSFNGTITLIR